MDLECEKRFLLRMGAVDERIAKIDERVLALALGSFSAVGETERVYEAILRLTECKKRLLRYRALVEEFYLRLPKKTAEQARRIFRGESVAEICKSLSVSENACYSAKRRALIAFRRFLSERNLQAESLRLAVG
ncbi:MAG: hypothetical protein IJF71_02310 [Clostridia bacterium]|nr:hypothetical protein [Clostridia bacterium]